MNKYYVYGWFNRDKNHEVIYIGKGKEKRYLVRNRNIYFNRVVDKYDCYPLILKKNLSEDEAFKIEKDFIKFFKNRGQAKCNLHEGGYGGNVFLYHPEGKKEMIRKCRIASTGKNNPMYGKSWKIFATDEKIEKHRENCRLGQLKRYLDPEEKIRTSVSTSEGWNKPGIKEKYHFDNSRRVYKYGIDGKYLKTYKNLRDAMIDLEVKNHTTFIKNIKLKKPYKKHYWIREDEKGVETIEKENNYFHLVE